MCRWLQTETHWHNSALKVFAPVNITTRLQNGIYYKDWQKVYCFLKFVRIHNIYICFFLLSLQKFEFISTAMQFYGIESREISGIAIRFELRYFKPVWNFSSVHILKLNWRRKTNCILTSSTFVATSENQI